MEIIGSIDNAFHVGIGHNSGVFHLIFTDHQFVAAQVMTAKERHKRMRIAQYTPLEAVSPMLGAVSTYKAVKNETMAMLEDGMARGIEIEKNLDGYIGTSPAGLLTLDYEAIDNAEFKQGTNLSLASLELFTHGKKWKYHLIHNNFEKSGKLDEDTLQRYMNTLQNAFQEKLSVR